MSYSMISLLTFALGLGTLFLYNEQTKKPVRKIEGKTVVVIGASSGIGKETAKEFATLGANLLLVARRKEELKLVCEECMDLNPKILVKMVVGDMTLPATRLAIQTSLADDFSSKVDFLILNAGIISVTSINAMLGITAEDSGTREREKQTADLEHFNSLLDRIMQVNFRAPVDIANLLLPQLYESRGSIIVVSSVAGIISAPTRSIYSASKAALNGYFQALRLEVAKHGVHIGIICPGTVDTSLRHSAVDLPSSKTGKTGKTQEISGSKTGKASPQSSAKVIVDAAINNRCLVVFPTQYKISVYLNTFYPSLIDYLAKRKYGY